MLKQILKQIERGGTTSVSALARQFDVSERLMEQMLAELVRLGYLRLLERCNQNACSGCPQQTNCHTQRPVHTWMVVKEIETASANDQGS